eukprot:1154273-Pelagomonas_calceolata.AAC.7
MDAVPDLDEQLFEAQEPAAPPCPASVNNAINSSGNRDTPAEPSSIGAAGSRGAAGAQEWIAPNAPSGEAIVAAPSASRGIGTSEEKGHQQQQYQQQQQQQQQQQEEGDQMQVDVPVEAANQRQQLHDDEEEVDDDELLQGAIPMDETEQAPVIPS